MIMNAHSGLGLTQSIAYVPILLASLFLLYRNRALWSAWLSIFVMSSTE